MKKAKHAEMKKTIKYELIALPVGILIVMGLYFGASSASQAEDISYNNPVPQPYVTRYASLPTTDEIYKHEYIELGYSDLYSYYEDLESMKADAEGLAEVAISVYSSVLSDEDIKNLTAYESKMVNAQSISMFNHYDELAGEIIGDADSKMPTYPSYSSGGSYQSGGYGVLTKSGGVNWFNGRKETWYSQRVLPGGGLRIPGRHVGPDGVIRDADGYIVVAASDLPYGSIIETSLGTGKVYDTGCAPGTTDIYTDW